MMPVRLLPLSALGILAAGLCAAPPRQDAGPPRAEKSAAVDRHGDPLPPGAIARIGTVRLQHAGRVNCVAFSPDGETLASAGADRTVRLWDVTTGREKRRFTCDVPGLRCVAFFPDGKKLATAGEELPVRIWDADTGKEVRRLALPRPWCRALAVSPDGKTLAAGSQDGLYLWDLTTDGEARHVNSANRGGPVKTLPFAFSGDSKRVAVAWGDKSIRLHEAATGKETGTRLDCRKHVWAIALAPDGKTLASVAYNDPTVRLWDIASGKERLLLEGHRKEVYVVTFSPDGKTLASTGSDETVRLWDVTTGKEQQCKSRPDLFNHLAFTPDGKTLAAASLRGTIQLWDAKGEPRRMSAEPPDGLRQVHFLPDGKTLISAGCETISSGDGVAVRRWEAATGKELRPRVADKVKVYSFALSRDGEVAAIATWEGEADNAQGKVLLYRVATGKELVRITVAPFAMAFTPDGQTLIFACWKEGIRLYQASTGKEVRRLSSGKIAFSILALSPDGTLLAAVGEELRSDGRGSGDQRIWLWDLTRGKELRRLQGSHSSISTLAFSPDGRLLASAGSERSGRTTWSRVVRLWQTATGKELRRLEKPAGGPDVAFSPDGRTLATCGTKGPHLWEAATGKERRQLRGHDGGISSVDFSPDGRLLASSSWSDRTALVWDLSAGARGGPAAPLSTAELQQQWDALAGEAATAYQALRDLAATPRQAVALLREHLRPVPAADPKRLARLIRDLDSGRFSVREQALKELEQLGDIALPALRKATQESPALETRRRLERLIEQAEGWLPEALRAWRALEVLEQIGTPEARQVLQILARGAAEARLTREARASLKRLASRSAGR